MLIEKCRFGLVVLKEWIWSRTFLHVQKLLSSDGAASLGLDDYQQFTRATNRNERSGIEGLDFALLGLFGETGSLLSELKKKQRDKDAYISYQDSIIEEFGDTLWYFANTACMLESICLFLPNEPSHRQLVL